MGMGDETPRGKESSACRFSFYALLNFPVLPFVMRKKPLKLPFIV
jgi:hypothetical protein